MGLIANQMLAEWCVRLAQKLGEKKRERKETKTSAPEAVKKNRWKDQGRG